MAKPIISWVGGKRRMLKYITPLLEKGEKDTFIDVFAGGMSVSLKAEELGYKTIIANDLQTKLINLYEMVRNDNDFINKVKVLQKKWMNGNENERKKLFYEKRDEYNKTHKPELMFFLVKTSFGHMYREKENGEFNTTIGHYKDKDYRFTADITKLINDFKKATKDFKYTNYSFEVLEKELQKQGIEINEKTVIFLDPPYDKRKKTSCSREYIEEKFTDKQQEELKVLADK